MAKKIRKCAYARVSTLAEEQEHSLAFQTHYYKTLIESENNSIFMGIYADTRSGNTARLRKQFTAMIKSARRGEIDYIYTKSISRFARNLVDTLKIVRELRGIGVGVLFEKEGIDTLDSSGDFMLSIYATVAESEIDSMGENVKWSARSRYKKGSVEINSNLYGYTLKEGKLVPVPYEARIVKDIFNRYINGEGLERIAKHLNSIGVAKKVSNGLWTSTDIGRMLDNEKYIGDALLQKTYKVGQKTIKNNGELPQYYVENSHDAIVDREVFDKAQKIREKRKASALKKRTPYPLSPFSSKIKCKECGKGYMRRKNNRNTPYEKWIWSCQTYVKQGRKYCSAHTIREKDLKEIFLSAYNQAASYKSPDSQETNLTESIATLLSQERELVALKVKGYITREAFEEQHKELLSQIKEMESALLLESRIAGGAKHEIVEEYDDTLVGSLDKAEIKGYTITFIFKNGASIKKKFNNNTNRKQTWQNKQGG